MRLFLCVLGLLFLPDASLAHHPETFTYIEKPKPVVPPFLQRSGYCCVKYDILPNGRTTNVKASYCTEKMIAPWSEHTISKYIYATKRQDGTPVTSTSLTVKLGYHLLDADGVPIPSSNGYMSPLPNGGFYKEKICSRPVA